MLGSLHKLHMLSFSVVFCRCCQLCQHTVEVHSFLNEKIGVVLIYCLFTVKKTSKTPYAVKKRRIFAQKRVGFYTEKREIVAFFEERAKLHRKNDDFRRLKMCKKPYAVK